MTTVQQNLLIDLLDGLGGHAGATDFQKLLFLYTKEFETKPSYDFVPYRFGCFSFNAVADRHRLAERGFITADGDGWQLTDAGRADAAVRRRASGPIVGFVRRYGTLRGDRLMAEVYRRYPYYATRSTIIERILPAEERDVVNRARPVSRKAGLLTIGYEGRSLEAYLNALLTASVTLLCDVRANPLSRKYGFSKKTLSNACTGVGIRYEHVPELGILSSERQELNNQADYDRLFASYRRTVLPKQAPTLDRIRQWVTNDGQRVALTCYERLPGQCHRHCVADALHRSMAGTLCTVDL